MIAPRPGDLLLLDVNETLSDLGPLADTFAEIGLAPQQAALWFAQVLREGFAVAMAGGLARFADVGRACAAQLLREAGGEPDDAERVLARFTTLDVHPDVRTGLPALAEAGVRLVTLSNGAAAVATSLLERAGLSEHVERVLSVEDAGIWKPGPHAYQWAVEQCGGRPETSALAAVHPWDVHGAREAGIGGVYVDRARKPWPPYLAEPSLSVDDFDALAGVVRTSA